MITSITILSAISKARGFFKAIPWQIYIGIAAIFVIWGAYAKGASDKNKEWIVTLEQAQKDAQIQSAEAAAKADTKQANDTQEFEAQQSELQKVIDDAKENNDNPLDAFFSSLSAQN